MDQVNDGPVDSGRPARIQLVKQSIPTCPQCGHRNQVCLVLDVDLVPLQFRDAGDHFGDRLVSNGRIPIQAEVRQWRVG